REAEAHAGEDKERRELVELRNQADQLVYQTDKNLKEHGDKLSADDRGRIESAKSELESAMKGDDKSALSKAIENYTKAVQKIADVLYRNSQPEGAGAKAGAKTDGGGGSGGKDDNVIDADFEVKS